MAQLDGAPNLWAAPVDTLSAARAVNAPRSRAAIARGSGGRFRHRLAATARRHRRRGAREFRGLTS